MYIRPPSSTLKPKTRIDDTKDIPKNLHNKTQELSNPTVATIYTHVSRIDKKIGPAAYALTLGQVTLHHLGRETEFNVYTAEITAIQLALEKLSTY
jgi:hypothetical protein